MKIAYLSSSRIPSREANSIHVMKMCQAFAHLGHEVTLVAPDERDGLETGVRDPYEFYGVDRCFKLTKIPGLVSRRFPLYGWQAGCHARRLDADVAFGRHLHACAVAAFSGVPTVWDAHMLTFLRHRVERRVFRSMIAVPAFRRLVVNCGALGRAVLSEVPELADRIVVAHNGADPVADDVQPADLGETGGRPQIGYLGHLYAGRGFEIIRDLAIQAPWADFHVIGGERESIDRIRHDPSVPGNLRLHGFVPPLEVDRFSLAFDVLLAPYQREVRTAGGGESGAWMSPLKLFGYMAAGKPILCSDLPVLREVIEDGQNGLLLPPEDPGAWVAALRRLVDCPPERERLGAAARADFLAHHTWRGRASRVLDGLGEAV